MDFIKRCNVPNHWLLGLESRGASFFGVKGPDIYFLVKAGSEMDNEENLRVTREFLKEMFSYTLKIKMVEG